MFYPLKENSINYITKYNFDPVDTLRSYKPEVYLYFRHMYDLSEEIHRHYPNYKLWLLRSYLPALLQQNNTAGYSIAVKDDFSLAGMCLIENTPNEKKISGLVTEKNFRNNKIAERLMKKSMDLLETNTPVFSVPTPLLPNVEPLIKKFNFEKTSVQALQNGVFVHKYNEGR